MPPSSKAEDVEAKYDVALNFPNLELHSAAASGNVGLVHYALTHGQPVNSVLHGVLPLHAACSGGSVPVVRMLIERGADVNAPRLPRRYSDGRKSNTPSVGAAGSTPLHFAAANGHAPIIQILLTCGAVPNKADKNGMTPEALAEINGHTDVIRVLRVWEHLQRQESIPTSASLSLPGPSSDRAEPGSPASSAHDIPLPDGIPASEREGSVKERPSVSVSGSRKGKERAMSVASNMSDMTTSSVVKAKRSLKGMFRHAGRSRSGSAATAPMPASPGKSTVASTPPQSPVPKSPESSSSPFHQAAPSEEVAVTGQPEIQVTSPPDGEPDSAHHEDAHEGDDEVDLASVYDDAIDIDPELLELVVAPEDIPLPDTPSQSQAASAVDLGLGRTISQASGSTSHSLGRVASPSSPTPPPPAPSAGAAISAGRIRSGSTSRRPSLPSILEKAAHPGAAFRAALHRGGGGGGHAAQPSPDSSPLTEESESPTLAHHPPKHFFRGRVRSNESAHSTHSTHSALSSTGSSVPASARAAARKYMSKQGLVQLFRRSDSPPSRSPSPPLKRGVGQDGARVPTAEELDEGIAKLRRASLELDMKEGRRSFEELERELAKISMDTPSISQSAPATKTRFFPSELVIPPLPAVDQFGRLTMPSNGASDQPPSPRSAGSSHSLPILGERPRSARARTGSGVISPSPLANEWSHSSDSDSGPRRNIRRARTEVLTLRRRGDDGPSLPGPVHVLKHGKPRSATLPSRNGQGDYDNQLQQQQRSGSMQIGSSSGEQVQGLGWDGGVDLRKVASGIFRRHGEAEMASHAAAAQAHAEEAVGSPLAAAENQPPENQGEKAEDDEDEGEDEWHDFEDRAEEPGHAAVDEDTPVAEATDPMAEDRAGATPVPEEPVAGTERLTSETERPADETKSIGSASAADSIASGGAAEVVEEPIVAVRKERSPVVSRFIELSDPPSTQPPEPRPRKLWGRLRGPSLDTSTVDASRLASSRAIKPPSPLRVRQLSGTDDPHEPVYEHKNPSEPRLMAPPPPPPPLPASYNDVGEVSQGRDRGKSVSSTTSTNTSGMAFSYYQSTSTPATSLTPPSLLSITLGSGFPPVPEDQVVHTMPPPGPRRISSRAEAEEYKKQSESDILQLAQMPPSVDSSRSLAAQLAAYGESHALEEEFAEREKRSLARGRGRGKEEDEEEEEEEELDARSWVSGDSGRVGRHTDGGMRSEVGSSGTGSTRSSVVGGSKRGSAGRSVSAGSIGGWKSPTTPSLFSVDAPRSTVPSINTIYDKRAAAYRDRLSALTAAPFPAASSASSRSRHRAATATAASESWFTAGPAQARRSGEAATEPDVDLHPDISNPLPMSSLSDLGGPRHPASKRRQGTVRSHSGSATPSSASKYTVPLPASLSISTLNSSHIHHQQHHHNHRQPRSSSSSSSQPHSPRTAPAPIADVVSTRYAGLQPQPGTSPYVSIFSTRYSAHPHDGGESDDDEERVRTYTVIENDWRGGHVVGKKTTAETVEGGLKKPGRWRNVKGAIGHLGGGGKK